MFAIAEMITTQNIHFTYPSGPSLKFPDIDLHEGDNLIILGPSGIGKTTLLHILSGFLKPNSGFVSVNGTEITQLSSRIMDQFRGDNIGMIFQRPFFIKSLNLLEHLNLILNLAGKHKPKKDIISVLEELDIASCSRKKMHQLSAGQQQRAAIANAIINDPKLILADEPTSSLDDDNCEIVVNLLKNQAEKSNANLIIITHDIRLSKNFQNSLRL